MANPSPYVTILLTDMENLRDRATKAEQRAEAYKELSNAYRARRSFITENGFCDAATRQRIEAAEAKVEELEAK